jgi:hypothetical protein
MAAQVKPLRRALRILVDLLSVRFQIRTRGNRTKTSAHARAQVKVIEL